MDLSKPRMNSGICDIGSLDLEQLSLLDDAEAPVAPSDDDLKDQAAALDLKDQAAALDLEQLSLLDDTEAPAAPSYDDLQDQAAAVDMSASAGGLAEPIGYRYDGLLGEIDSLMYKIDGLSIGKPLLDNIEAPVAPSDDGLENQPDDVEVSASAIADAMESDEWFGGPRDGKIAKLKRALAATREGCCSYNSPQTTEHKPTRQQQRYNLQQKLEEYKKSFAEKIHGMTESERLTALERIKETVQGLQKLEMECENYDGPAHQSRSKVHAEITERMEKYPEMFNPKPGSPEESELREDNKSVQWLMRFFQLFS